MKFSEIETMVGKTFLYGINTHSGRCDRGEEDIYIPVLVKEIKMRGCSVKASCEIIDGIGEIDCCPGDLLFNAEAKQRMDEAVSEHQVKEMMREFDRYDGVSLLRARFIALVNKHCNKEEIQNITEDAKEEGFESLKRVQKTFIRTEAERVIRKVLNKPAPVEVECED